MGPAGGFPGGPLLQQQQPPQPQQLQLVQQQPPPQHQQGQGPQQQQQQQTSQRVFTGTVTKLHDNFGFVDEDVFFQTSVVKGQAPRVNVCFILFEKNNGFWAAAVVISQNFLRYENYS